MIVSYILAILLNTNPVIIQIVGDYKDNDSCTKAMKTTKIDPPEEVKFLCIAVAHEAI